MDGTSFMSVDEVAQTLGVSKSYAYKIVHQLNAELKAEGYLTISGRVNKEFSDGAARLSRQHRHKPVGL